MERCIYWDKNQYCFLKFSTTVINADIKGHGNYILIDIDIWRILGMISVITAFVSLDWDCLPWLGLPPPVGIHSTCVILKTIKKCDLLINSLRQWFRFVDLTKLTWFPPKYSKQDIIHHRTPTMLHCIAVFRH